MSPKLLYLPAAVVGVSAILWTTYWSGYQSGYVKVKNEQYSTIYVAALEKVHLLKMVDASSNEAIKSDIKQSIRGSVVELETLNSYLQRLEESRVWSRIYGMAVLAYRASELPSEGEDRVARRAALAKEFSSSP